jgi:hypothetical protein
MDLGKTAVEAGEDDPVHVMKEGRDPISLLRVEADKARAKSLKVGNSRLLASTDAQAQQLMHLEAGARILRESRARGFMSGVKEAMKEILQNFER